MLPLLFSPALLVFFCLENIKPPLLTCRLPWTDGERSVLWDALIWKLENHKQVVLWLPWFLRRSLTAFSSLSSEVNRKLQFQNNVRGHIEENSRIQLPLEQGNKHFSLVEGTEPAGFWTERISQGWNVGGHGEGQGHEGGHWEGSRGQSGGSQTCTAETPGNSSAREPSRQES